VSKLFFTLRKDGSRFRLYRDVDVSQPVRHEDRTLDEVGATLNTGSFVGSMSVEQLPHPTALKAESRNSSPVLALIRIE
jgi:hypothetical protein